MSKVIKVKEADAELRSRSFEEVVLGYTEEEALAEAGRCLQCKNPICSSGCPVGVDIKKFIYYITQKDYAAAYQTIREKNNFPAICGRVCPAEYQCRNACVFTKKGSPFASEKAINIHYLERFVADACMKQGTAVTASRPELSGFKVAVVGAGPAGMCCAGELARWGVKVVIFEGLHDTGGVLRYGIPPFRLPREVLDFEINELKKLDVEIIPNFIVGRTRSVKELFAEGFHAVFLGLGAGIPSFLNIPGENLGGVYSANEFLTRVNLMKAYEFPKCHTPVEVGRHVVVIGGGNTAMDAARVALRLQKMSGLEPDTTILYRRTEMEMPARRLEIEHAREEGVKFELLVNPKAFFGDKKGRVTKVRCARCELGAPDVSGRRRPVELAGSEFEMECDVAVEAIGLKANEILTKVTPEIKVDKWGDVVVDSQTMETSLKNVFAGGDIVGGEGTVIEAMGMAKRAARAIIDRLLMERKEERK